ncbi:MAG: hypothetical protein GC150_16265 [Rhizobiales bacterium]|nr:hypothetical protein [Hyphomicrobiales bacterium]
MRGRKNEAEDASLPGRQEEAACLRQTHGAGKPDQGGETTRHGGLIESPENVLAAGWNHGNHVLRGDAEGGQATGLQQTMLAFVAGRHAPQKPSTTLSGGRMRGIHGTVAASGMEGERKAEGNREVRFGWRTDLVKTGREPAEKRSEGAVRVLDGETGITTRPTGPLEEVLMADRGEFATKAGDEL